MLAPALGQVLRRSRARDYLVPEGVDPLRARTLLRCAPRESDTCVHAIDGVGACPPGGATGPMGSVAAADRLKGIMPVDLFEPILDKTVADGAAERPTVWLCNWGEPLLHPTLGALIRAVKQHGLSCRLKTHLSDHESLRELAQANPDELTISLAALVPERDADLRQRAVPPQMKARLHRLRQSLDEARATTRVCVKHPLYKGARQGSLT